MQSYDYAAVMKRYDKGLQTNLNEYAEYVPCTAHFLNLVRENLHPQYLKLLTIFCNSYTFYTGASGSQFINILCSFSGFHYVCNICQIF